MDLSIASAQKRHAEEQLLAILKTLFIVSFLGSNLAYGYTKNRAPNGKIIKWKDSKTTIDFVYHGSNEVILADVLGNWNQAQAKNIVYTLGNGNASEDVNDIYTSNSSIFFGGGGVAAVTNITFDYASGEIVETDIIVNSAIAFSVTEGQNEYLGDVLSHEIGHALGLAHSEVKHSTMFYWLTRGQHSLSKDDLAGAHALYPDASAAKGKISGRVAGGSNVGVFGAHVQAISENNGDVVAGALTESDGSFEIDGVPLNDRYVIYVAPLNVKSTLPNFYEDARSDFCASTSNYRGTFYQSCEASKKGMPKSLALEASAPTLSIGTISIRCDLDVPIDYMEQKETLFEIPSVDVFGNPGRNMVGFMSAAQIQSATADRLRIDLRDYDVAAQANLYLEFHVSYQSLYSVMHLQAEVERSGVAQTIIDTNNAAHAALGSSSQIDADNNPNLDLVGRVPLSIINANNDFELILSPQNFDDWENSVAGYDSEDFYSRRGLFADDLAFYLLSYRVVQNNGGVFSTYAQQVKASFADNSACLDAPGTYKIVGSIDQTSQTSSPRRSAKDDGGFACGSVDIDPSNHGGGNFSGFLSFLIGLVILAAMSGKSLGRNNLV